MEIGVRRTYRVSLAGIPYREVGSMVSAWCTTVILLLTRNHSELEQALGEALGNDLVTVHVDWESTRKFTG